MELAIWFHDAVYQPGAADNERRSAALLRDRMNGLVSAPTLAAAETMVLATERHAVPPGLPASLEADIAAFLDIDMAVLGAEPADYDRYTRDVAVEFIPVVGEDAYRSRRAAGLGMRWTAGRGSICGASWTAWPCNRTPHAAALQCSAAYVAHQVRGPQKRERAPG